MALHGVDHDAVDQAAHLEHVDHRSRRDALGLGIGWLLGRGRRGHEQRGAGEHRRRPGGAVEHTGDAPSAPSVRSGRGDGALVSHDGERWFEPYRLIIVAGKGGVGKTTVAASLARAAAAEGRSVLVIDTEGKRGLAAALGADDLRYEPSQVVPPTATSGEVTGRRIRPDRALRDYLDSHGLRRVSRRLTRSGLFEMVSTGTPGIKDVLVLGKIRAIVDDGEVDLVVVDGPAAGHAISFLRAARDVLGMVDSGPINRQARQVFDLLSDHGRTAISLVTLAEHTPVNELSETAFALEDQLHLELAPIVVNGLEPAGWTALEGTAAPRPAAAAYASTS